MIDDVKAGPVGTRQTLAAIILFVAVVGALHFAVRDPYRTYCEDIEHGFLPQMAYTYAHPWEAFQAHPTPSCNFGTSNYLTDGGPAALAPAVTALLARVAPRDPRRLALFEWRITSGYLLVSMTALFLFLRLTGTGAALAAAVACSSPFAFTTFYEWRHADLTRGRLMIAVVLLGLWAATRLGGYRGWLLLAASVVACMAQASQLYWVAALVLYWVLASAWLERRRLLDLVRSEGLRVLRRAGPPLVALAVVAIALGPMYLRSRAAMSGSAFYAELAHDPQRVLYYLLDGRDWFSAADLLTVERGFLPWSVAGLCLLAGGAAWRKLRRRDLVAESERGPAFRSSRLVALALPLFFGSLLLAFVPDLALHLLVVREGHLELSFAPIAIPTALAVLFHTTVRTWLVLAQTGALVAGAAVLAEWSESSDTLRDRCGQLAAALAVFAGLVVATGRISAEPIFGPAQWRALLAIGAVLLVALGAGAGGRGRRLGRAALIALGVIFAAYLTTSHYEAGMDHCSRGEANAAALLARDEAVLAGMPAEARGQRTYRVFGEKWCYYLDAPCTLSYGLRTMPQDVLRFFEAAGAVRDVRLPYWLHLDYGLLLESGIAQMLGIRWWILPAEVGDVGTLLTEVGAPHGLRLLEANGAFPKGWALQSWETADSFEDAVARVMAFGRAGELERRGVVETPLYDSLVWSAPAPSVETIGIEPGRLSFRVRSALPTVLATNEFFHPEWHAAIDGNPVEVRRVNAAFLGAEVPAGEHGVTFER